MSKCKPGMGPALVALERYGVEMEDVTTTQKGITSRYVVIRIPYEALRDEKEVQVAFQDIVAISTVEPN